MRRLLILAVLFPVPVFRTNQRSKPSSSVSVPAPEWTAETEVVENAGTVAAEPPQVHNAKPTVVPKRLTHSGLGIGCSDPYCRMCAGQHLRNYHGESCTKLEKMGYRKWLAYHKQLHREGVSPKAKAQSGCPGGICPTPSRRPILTRFFRGARR